MANLLAIPPTPAGLPPALQQQLNALALSMNVLNGVTGNGSGAATTLAMLSNAGLLALDPTTGNYVAPGALDYAIPPAPTGLVASGALGNVILTWDNPAYSNHSYTEIWREQVVFTGGVADPSIIGNAVKIGTSAGIVGVYVDATGAASDCWYWVKFVSTANVTGAFNAIAGVRGTTSASPAYLMSLLNGAITSSELAASLATPISLITAPSSTAGSVAAQVLAETNARIAAITAEATTRAAAITAEAAARGTAITAEATTRAGAVDNLAQSISLITAGVAGGFDPGAMWYFDANVESWVGTNGTLTWNAGWIDFNATAATPRIESPTVAVTGTQYATIRARVKRLAGAGWSGSAHYATAGHGLSESYVKIIATDPIPNVGDISVLEWDMTALDAGGTDWVSNTIIQIAIDLGLTSADDFSFDWIAVGRNAPGASMAGLMTEQTARTNGDTANAASITTLSTQVNHATTGLPAAHSAISSEATARADAVLAVSGQVTALSATVTGNQTSNTAAITTEQIARAAGDAANANSISTISAQVNNVLTGLPAAHAAVASEANARVTGDAANASAITSLSAQVNDAAAGLPAAHAAITSEASTRASAVSAVASRADALEASVNSATSGLNTKASVGYVDSSAASVLAASASSIATVQSQLNTGGATALSIVAANNAALAAQSAANSAQTTADTAVVNAAAAQSSANSASTAAASAQSAADTSNAALVNIASDSILSPSEKPSIAQDYSVITGEQAGIDAQATAYSITTEKATYDTSVSDLTSYLSGLTGWDVVPGTDVAIVGAIFRGKFAAVYTARQVLLNAITAKAKILADTAQAQANAATTNAASAQAAAETAQATANTGVANAATAQTTADTAVTASSANATSISTLQTTVGGHTASISTQATSINGLSAQYTVKIDADGYVSGFGLASTIVNGTPYSSFIIRADTFAIGGAGYATNYPFVVSTVNGVAAVGISGSLIVDGSIMSDSIHAGAVTADKITTISLSALSANMGSITAGSMNINNQFIVDSFGNLTATSGNFSGSLSGADITGATGAFGGSLTAGVVDITKLIGTTTNYTTPGTYTLTVPMDKTSMTVLLIGGGGGGGGGADWTRYGTGGGGGSGGITIATFTDLWPGATYELTIGSGGIGGSYVDYPFVNPGQNATSGGSTTITALVSAAGGGAGQNPFNAAGRGYGGAAGNANGAAGSRGEEPSWLSGNGGQGGGTTYGAGGAGGLGNRASSPGGTGAVGLGYGGGGGGGSCNSRPSTGGNGAPGYARIEFYNPNSVVLQTEYSVLKTALTSQGIATTGAPANALLPGYGAIGSWQLSSAGVFTVNATYSGASCGCTAGSWRCHTATSCGTSTIYDPQTGGSYTVPNYINIFQRIA